jgi:hypothetical protein
VGSAVDYGTLSAGQGFFSGLYSDLSGSTTSVDYQLYKYNKTTLRWDLADSATESGSSNIHNFTIAGVSNNTYLLNMTGHSALFGTVRRSAEHTFQPQWTLLGFSWPSWANLYFVLAIILGIAYAGTRRYELGVGVLLIATVFSFDMLGMMSSFATHEMVFILLTLMTIMVIIYAVAKWRREHGH